MECFGDTLLELILALVIIAVFYLGIMFLCIDFGVWAGVLFGASYILGFGYFIIKGIK